MAGKSQTKILSGLSVNRSECQNSRQRSAAAALSARERSGQIEPWDHAVFEAGHGRDLVAAEGEYIEADPVAYAGRGA